MKKFLLVLISFWALGLGTAWAQEGQAADKDADGAADGNLLPIITIKGTDGHNVSTADFDNGGKPIIISFWATWCKPCIQELVTIADEYEDWQEETGVKLIAISIDDTRNSAKVGPFAEGKGWEYEIYLDENSDLKRALNVNNVPHTFLLNGKKEIVWNHNSYTPGDEEELHEVLVRLAKTGKVEE